MCPIDTEPRKLNEKEQRLLKKLADVAMEQTELRQHNLSLLQEREEFIAIASHELRTLVTALKAAVQVLHTHQGNETPPLQHTVIKILVAT